MKESTWMTLEEAGRYLDIPYARLWDYIMGRVKGKSLNVYRLAGGEELRLRKEDLLDLLEPVTDRDLLGELEKRPPRPRKPEHLF
ncbi:MAG: hypothetical protein JXA37_01205 [Chloroflexia bacterium]|nr:hypothetical protein [Chloroflexia bacterium]